MKHWYKSAPMKGILLILEHIFAVLAVLCVVFILIYPGQEYGKNLNDLSKSIRKQEGLKRICSRHRTLF